MLRNWMSAGLDAEIATLEAAGTRVIRLDATAEDLAVMGPNFMDDRRRLATLEHSLVTTRSQLRTEYAETALRHSDRRGRYLRHRSRDTLKRSGIDDFAILEKGDSLGGHLARQRLPGLRVRRPVRPVLLLVRTEPGVDRLFAGQDEIRRLHRPHRRRTRGAPHT